jgi:ATP phosphoribosyltransferase
VENIMVIATKYPNTAKRYLENMKKNCIIIKMNGCLELYPNIGLCDAIIDLVESGKTLEANGLEIIRDFDPISTRIITTQNKANNSEIKKLIYKLR